MRQNVIVALYANKYGNIMDKGHLPEQLGCAAMVKVWVESNLIDKFDLYKHSEVNIHYIEGRGYILELQGVDWVYCQPDTAMSRLKNAVMEFIDAFGLKKANTLAACDYGMEIATVSRDQRSYTHHTYGNHNYAIELKHRMEASHTMMQPLSTDDSDWIGENRHGL
jgi:hypothetical protein